MRAMELSFLIQPHSGLSSQLIARKSIPNVMIHGPYGKNLHLDEYETVILIAKGIGIAGILPYARHMAYRRLSKDKSNEEYRRGLMTRKLDIIWVLDDNYQDMWVSEYMQQLQMKDKDKVDELGRTGHRKKLKMAVDLNNDLFLSKSEVETFGCPW